MFDLNKLSQIIISLLLIHFLIDISCEINRSPISIEDKPQYSYYYINDYDFIYQRYFFVDAYYRDRYEKGFSDDLSLWYFEEGTLINELSVYRSTRYSEKGGRKGVATIPSRFKEFENLPNLNAVESLSGEVEIAEFVPMKEGRDYHYDYVRGFFWLNNKIKSTEILAVAYRTKNDTVGTLLSTIDENDSTQFYVLRLIKPRTMQEWDELVWPLMMKNVYFLGDTSFAREGFNITIRKIDSHEMIQQENPRFSYINLMGLDIIKDYGEMVEGGDGIIDDNYLLINRFTGILMFPGLQPFDPLPGSRFQIADTNMVQLYNTIYRDQLVESSKFEIVVKHIKN